MDLHFFQLILILQMIDEMECFKIVFINERVTTRPVRDQKLKLDANVMLRVSYYFH